MVFSTPERCSGSDAVTEEKKPATGLFGSVTALVALCARKASRVTKKLRMKPSQASQEPQPSPRSPLARPKEVLKTISHSAITLVHRKKKPHSDGASKEEEEEEWGAGGVWQREILMGDKCQPLDFSGVIYYDGNGKQMNEVPLRSPRASPLPGYLTRQAGF